jgi:hypothetical protein
MPRQNRPQLVGIFGQRLVQRHARAAGIGKQHIDAVIDERLDKNIRPAHELRVGRFGRSGRHETVSLVIDLPLWGKTVASAKGSRQKPRTA